MLVFENLREFQLNEEKKEPYWLRKGGKRFELIDKERNVIMTGDEETFMPLLQKAGISRKEMLIFFNGVIANGIKAVLLNPNDLTK